MENKKNCWIIPTDKSQLSCMFYDSTENLVVNSFHDYNCNGINLYITNDEIPVLNSYVIHRVFGIGQIVEIKGEECFVSIKIKPTDGSVTTPWMRNIPDIKKIVFATDINLIKKGVQSVPNEFLDWFKFKNGKVDFVDVKTEKVINYSFPISIYDRYIITVPDEKPLQNLKKESVDLPFPQLLKEFYNYSIGYDPIEDSKQDKETDRKYTKQDIIEFAKWIATPELHGYGKQLYEAKTRHKVDKLEDLIDIWLKQNNKNMEMEQNKLYDIHLQLSYGELLIEDIEAGSEEEATDIAIEKATNELSYAKTSVFKLRDKI